jgi:hypothetical protein
MTAAKFLSSPNTACHTYEIHAGERGDKSDRAGQDDYHDLWQRIDKWTTTIVVGWTMQQIQGKHARTFASLPRKDVLFIVPPCVPWVTRNEPPPSAR